MKKLLWIGCLSYLLTGFTHVILGAVLPELLHRYNGSYSDGGRLVFLEFAGFLGGVLLMPRLAALISRRRALLLAAALLGAAETCLSLLPPWGAVMGLAAVAGFGFGLTEAGIGTFVLIAAKEKQAVAMSRLEVFFGLGGLLMPFIAGFLITHGMWRLSFLVLGVSALGLIPVWLRMSFGELDGLLAAKSTGDGKSKAGSATEEQTAKKESGGALSSPAAESARYGAAGGVVLGLFICIFFSYVGAEVSIVNYLPSVFSEKLSVPASTATLSVTFYWLAMVAGRLVAGTIAEKSSYFWFLAVTVAGTIVALVALGLTRGLAASFAFVLASGLLMAGLFAVALIYANRLLPAALTERTSSLLIASGGLGGALMPLLVGRIMDAVAAEAAIWSAAVAMTIMLALLLAAAVATRRSRPAVKRGAQTAPSAQL